MKFNGNTMAAVMAVEQEALPIGGGFMEGTLGTKGIRLTEDVDYGKELPATAPTGTLFFVEDTEENAVADFVVEQGEKDGWTYRKWKSGIFECWMRKKSVEFTYGTNQSGLYWGYCVVFFPFAFSDEPVVTYSAYATNGYDFCGKAQVEKDKATVHIGSLIDLTAVETVQINAQVVGRWK